VSAPEFVAVGHVTLDRVGDTVRPGGAALYAAVAADRLGVSAGLLTRHGPDFPLEQIPTTIEVVSLPSRRTTAFTRTERDGRPRLVVTGVADAIAARDVPGDWRRAPLVLLAPALHEVGPRLAAAFTDASIGLVAQGWLRRRESDGTIAAARWPTAAGPLSAVQAVFVGEEDIDADAAAVIDRFQRVPLGVITRRRGGGLLFVNGERYEVRPYPARPVDPRGAGAVFAATFLLSYRRDGDPWAAAAAGVCAAALAVEGEGFWALPDRARLDTALAEYGRWLGPSP
jgi:sugar/nucleoside kinase (ribokinase family)